MEISSKPNLEFLKTETNVVTKYGWATKENEGYPGKPNQDTYIITPHIGKEKSFHLFAIADGHGKHGHDISGFIKSKMPTIISKKIETDKRFGKSPDVPKLLR